MGITVHNHRYPIFFAVFQHDGIILYCILTVTVRVHGVIVQLQDFTVFSGSLYKRLIIDIVSSVIRMSDDIDTRILHSIKIGLRILLSAAWSDAWNMKTCNDHVQLLQGFLLKIYRPKNGSQLVWVKWHTPKDPGTVKISVSVSGAGTAKTSFLARIVSLEENIPPDPLATDTNPGFSTSTLPSEPVKTNASWSVWSASWHAKWEWEPDWHWESEGHSKSCPKGCTTAHGEWVDDGEWVDNGWYDFTSTGYHVALFASSDISPDDIVPTKAATP